MTSSFNSTILNLIWNGCIKIFLKLEFNIKFRVMPCVALNTYSPTRLSHSKYKCPSLIRIKISICEYQETLVIAKRNSLFQIFTDLSPMKLFHFSVLSNSCFNYFLFFQLTQCHIYFFTLLLSFWVGCTRGNIFLCSLLVSNYWNAFKEYLYYRLHVINEVLLKGFLLLMVCFFPHRQ